MRGTTTAPKATAPVAKTATTTVGARGGAFAAAGATPTSSAGTVTPPALVATAGVTVTVRDWPARMPGVTATPLATAREVGTRRRNSGAGAVELADAATSWTRTSGVAATLAPVA